MARTLSEELQGIGLPRTLAGPGFSRGTKTPKATPPSTSGSMNWLSPNANTPYPNLDEPGAVPPPTSPPQVAPVVPSGAISLPNQDTISLQPPSSTVTTAQQPLQQQQAFAGLRVLGGQPQPGDEKLAELDRDIGVLMSSGSSVFDMWRGRQKMKQRDALSAAMNSRSQAETQRMFANIGAQRAANEQQAAQAADATQRLGIGVRAYGDKLQAQTARRGQDIGLSSDVMRDVTQRRATDFNFAADQMRDVTQRRATDFAAATQRREQDFAQMARMPEVVKGQMAAEAYAQNDIGRLEGLGVLAAPTPTKRAPMTAISPTDLVLDPNTGRTLNPKTGLPAYLPPGVDEETLRRAGLR